MATVYAEFDVSDDWQTANNWSTAAVPLADDIVIFDSRVVNKPAQGMLDGESGAAAQCTFDLLHFKEDYALGVGSDTEPLCCAPDKIIIDGSGTYHILCGTVDQATDATIPLCIINNEDAIVYLYSNVNSATKQGKWTKIIVVQGTVTLAYYDPDTLDYGCVYDYLHLMPKNNKASAVTVTIEKDAYNVETGLGGNIVMSNGILTCDSKLESFLQLDGTTTYGTDGAAETDMDITDFVLFGGVFTWLPDDTGDDAYIADMAVYGGVFDASSETNADRIRYLGNGAGHDIYLYSGAIMDLRNGRGNVQIATDSQLFNFGGTLRLDNYTQIGLIYDAA